METDKTKGKVVVGITGGIGAGKSVVSRILRLKGYNVYDCDTRAKELMSRSGRIFDALRDIAGEEVVSTDGTLDRSALARRLFSDDEVRASVNDLVHSEVRLDFADHVAHADCNILFVESAILASSGLAESCEAVILVSAPEDLRVERVMLRNGLDESEAKERIRSQREEENCLARYSDRVVTMVNDGTVPLLGQVDGFLESLKNLQAHTNFGKL